MKLMSMTFVRTTELIEAKWEEFDLENARWDIPAERMKMRTPHTGPLARQALEVLEMLHDPTGQEESLQTCIRREMAPRVRQLLTWSNVTWNDLHILL
jgi:integrase